jgi:lactate dehydrogenase-like 2-hydroxyacid dehydrogenase
MYKGYRPVIKVYCSECQEQKDESKTEFVDIAEDIQGSDVLTFVCPDCKTTQKSRRYG